MVHIAIQTADATTDFALFRELRYYQWMKEITNSIIPLKYTIFFFWCMEGILFRDIAYLEDWIYELDQKLGVCINLKEMLLFYQFNKSR